MSIGLSVIFALAVIWLIVVSIQKILKQVFKKKGKSYYPSFLYIVILGYFILTAVGVCIMGFACEWDLRPSGVFAIIIVNFLLSFLYTYVYFLPYLVANKKKHPQTKAIYILNIFAGWTVLAWIIALIWSSTESQNKVIVKQSVQSTPADELAKYKLLLDNGVITQEEFENKKKELLNL